MGSQANGAERTFGISEDGLNVALSVRDQYRRRQPICIPGERSRMLIPEHLLNNDINLRGMEDPLPLAMMAARDPESPMALAAATRLSPLANNGKLISAVVEVVGETTRHPLVSQCLGLIRDSAFDPDTIALVRRHAVDYVIKTRRQYTGALRHNLHSLLQGSIAPRQFVKEFFELTEAGNMRNDIRKKLVVSLFLSENVRPSIKFLLLENFERMPPPVRVGIISAILGADPTHHTELIKEELRWIVSQEQAYRRSPADEAALALP